LILEADDTHRSYSQNWPKAGLMLRGQCSEQKLLELRIAATGGGVLLPTLTASNHGSNQGGGRQGRVGKMRHSLETLARKGLLPTLTVEGNRNRVKAGTARGDGLATALKRRLPTLVASDSTRGARALSTKRGGSLVDHLTESTPAEEEESEAGGPLNPTWCEWFMGWPIGSTKSEPLEMDKFQLWLRAHSWVFSDD
jgi:hypothetical protein